MALINKLTAIGDAIRSKTGTTAELSLDDMVTAINSISTTGTGTIQTAVLTASYNRFYVDNYVEPGENFVLFYTAKSSQGGNYVISMWMPDWSKHIYNLHANIIATDDFGYNANGIKTLKTSNIDVASTQTTLSNKTNSTIEFDGTSFYYSSDTGCKVGTSAILLYVG